MRKPQLYYRFRRFVNNLYYQNFIYHRYFDDTKSIFIHIPKAAGTSIAKALYNRDPRHVNLLKYKKKNISKYEEYFKFVFVRNPYDRISSAYYYLKKQQEEHNYSDSSSPFYFLKYCNSFDEFVLVYLRDKGYINNYFFKPQVEYLRDPITKKMLSVDFIGKLENIEKDYEFVKAKLGVARNLKHNNKGTLTDYNKNVETKTINVVKELYSEDYFYFGYEK